jgi:hypothetical protein
MSRPPDRQSANCAAHRVVLSSGRRTNSLFRVSVVEATGLIGEPITSVAGERGVQGLQLRAPGVFYEPVSLDKVLCDSCNRHPQMLGVGMMNFFVASTYKRRQHRVQPSFRGLLLWTLLATLLQCHSTAVGVHLPREQQLAAASRRLAAAIPPASRDDVYATDSSVLESASESAAARNGIIFPNDLVASLEECVHGFRAVGDASRCSVSGSGTRPNLTHKSPLMAPQ